MAGPTASSDTDTHTHSEILSKILKRTTCHTHGNRTLVFLFFAIKTTLCWRWGWHPKLQTRNRTTQQQVTFILLRYINLIQITRLLPNRRCSFNSRATALLQWFNLHLLPPYSLFARICFLYALQFPCHQLSNTGPSSTTWQTDAEMHC